MHSNLPTKITVKGLFRTRKVVEYEYIVLKDRFDLFPNTGFGMNQHENVTWLRERSGYLIAVEFEDKKLNYSQIVDERL